MVLEKDTARREAKPGGRKDEKNYFFFFRVAAIAA